MATNIPQNELQSVTQALLIDMEAERTNAVLELSQLRESINVARDRNRELMNRVDERDRMVYALKEQIANMCLAKPDLAAVEKVKDLSAERDMLLAEQQEYLTDNLALQQRLKATAEQRDMVLQQCADLAAQSKDLNDRLMQATRPVDAADVAHPHSDPATIGYVSNALHPIRSQIDDLYDAFHEVDQKIAKLKKRIKRLEKPQP